MPTRENLSDQRVVTRFNAEITTNTQTVTVAANAVDTADHEMGVFFAAMLADYTDGSYKVELQESDVANFASSNVIAEADILGSYPTLTEETAEGSQLFEFGLTHTKRYVRVLIISSGVTTGARVIVVSVEKGEYNPQNIV